MNNQQFDQWTRALRVFGASRRAISKTFAGGALTAVLVRSFPFVLSRGATATAFGLAALGGPRLSEAKKKHKRKKKIERNEFGCVDVGTFCKNDGQCCSGICQGKKGKKRCKAHDTGTGCQAGQTAQICGGTDVTCTTSTGFPQGLCATTTGNAAYCSANTACQVCARDVDCHAEFGPQAACVVCNGCAEGTACDSPDDLD
jgi:hypothetical protein